MENQSTNKIICRKCGGPHLTIKCGKEKAAIKEEIEPVIKEEIKTPKLEKEYKPRFKVTYRVKISELPLDMTEEEMMELTADWGHIVKVKVINYEETSTAYIDFGYEDEADYFIKAIDKTPFDYLLISAQRVDSIRKD